MVQFTRLSPKQNIGSDLGQAIGQGLATGAKYGLQEQYNQVKDEQKLQKNVSALQKALEAKKGADFSSLQKAILTSGMDPEYQKTALQTLGQAEQLRIRERQLTQPTPYQSDYLAQLKENHALRSREFALRFQKFEGAPQDQKLKNSGQYFTDQIKVLQALLNKKDFTKNKEQVDAIQEEIKNLGLQRDRVAQKILRGETIELEDYGLNSAGQELPTTEQASVQGNQAGTGVVQAASNKPKFDAANPEHRATAQKLYTQFKDKEKVRQALAKEFEI